jgi:predicted Fe-Mo cluster-binding NifX family protein
MTNDKEDVKTMRIAVPSMLPGGLEAPVEAHFGHSQAFTIVTLQDRQVAEVQVMPNGHHGAGSCGAPVGQLVEAGVKALVVGGIGMRPLELLRSQGIGVFTTKAATVGQAVSEFVTGALPGFDDSQACGGGHAPGECHGHK